MGLFIPIILWPSQGIKGLQPGKHDMKKIKIFVDSSPGVESFCGPRNACVVWITNRTSSSQSPGLEVMNKSRGCVCGIEICRGREFCFLVCFLDPLGNEWRERGEKKGLAVCQTKLVNDFVPRVEDVELCLPYNIRLVTDSWTFRIGIHAEREGMMKT